MENLTCVTHDENRKNENREHKLKDNTVAISFKTHTNVKQNAESGATDECVITHIKRVTKHGQIFKKLEIATNANFNHRKLSFIDGSLKDKNFEEKPMNPTKANGQPETKRGCDEGLETNNIDYEKILKELCKKRGIDQQIDDIIKLVITKQAIDAHKMFILF